MAHRSRRVNFILALLFIMGLLTLNGLTAAQITPQGGVVGTGTPGSCTETQLRNAIVGGGTVTFNCGSGTATITIGNQIDVSQITGTSVTIDGGTPFENAPRIILQGNGGNRIFSIGSGEVLFLKNLRLSNGQATGGDPNGGAVRVVLGGVFMAEQVEFVNNQADQFGGAIVAENQSFAYISRSSFLNNTALTGGAILIKDTGAGLDVANSTFIGNTASNTAQPAAGAIRAGSGTTANLTNVTFANNSNIDASPISGQTLSSGGTINIRNIILYGVPSGKTHCHLSTGGVINGAFNLTEVDGNIIDIGTTCGTQNANDGPDVVSAVASLGAQTGFPAYLPLNPGSPGADNVLTCNYRSASGNTLFLNNGQIDFDQPGNVRPVGIGCDPGAHESPSIIPTVTPTSSNTPGPTPTPTNTASKTFTPLPSNTPLPTHTFTATLTPSNTLPPSATPTASDTPTEFPTDTPIPTDTNTPTDTFTPLPTNTPGGPTDTPTSTFTATFTPSNTPLPTNTDTPLPTSTPTFTNTPTATVTITPSSTPNPSDLIVNGGFEVDANADKVPDNWTPKNITGDKRKCNTDGSIIAFEGECALVFKGSVGENSKFEQLANVALATEGNTLTLSAQINTALPAAGKVILVNITYTDPTAGVNGNGIDKLQIVLSAPTANGTYQLFTTSLVLDGTPSKIKTQLRNKNSSGKIRMDAVSLIVDSGGALVPLP